MKTKRTHSFIVFITIFKVMDKFKDQLEVQLRKHRHEAKLQQLASLIQCRYRFKRWSQYNSLQRRHQNQIRHSLTSFATFNHDMVKNKAKWLIMHFLAESQRLVNIKNMTVSTI